ncbi:hypothetical protein ABR738_08665 [Streptomyces sp. Edi4]|uniref:hypothetical protein n=1 Tax=Streptomyces sp. Edi4 TaxID=3162527 RepID=UPI0033067B37
MHAAARQVQGLEPSDLEREPLDVRGAFVDAEEIAACGRVYADASARTAASLFPEQIAARPVETPSTLDDPVRR